MNRIGWLSLITGVTFACSSLAVLRAEAAPEAASNLPNKRYVLMVAGDSAGPATPTPTNPPPTPTITATPTVPPTLTPVPAPVTFGTGTFLVGSDIPARTYRTRSATDGCYWERLNGLGGTLDEIESNDFTDGTSVVSISQSDVAFRSSRCAVWTTDLSPITSSPTAPLTLSGTVIVNVDIAPGIWRSAGGDGCYWERLTGFSGDLSDIEANDFTTGGPVVVQIAASDKGFSSSRCGTWTRQ